MIQCTCGRYNKSNKEECLCGKAAVAVPHKDLKKLRKSTVNKVSEKRQTLNELYSIVRQVYLNLVPVCEAKGCNRLATTIHHKKGRLGNNGTIPLLIDMQNFMSCCIECHQNIENSPEWAIEQGYSIKRTNL